MILGFKQFFVFFVLLCLMGEINAQNDKNKNVPNLKGFDEKPIHFGFLIGFNTMNFNVQHSGAATPENGNNPRYAELLSLQPGINLGIIASLRIRKNLNLRMLPGISFGQRDLTFVDSKGVKEDEALQLKSTFLEMPIMLKYGLIETITLSLIWWLVLIPVTIWPRKINPG